MVGGGVEAEMQYDAIAVAATLGLAFGQTAAEPSTFMGRGSGFAEEAAPSARAGEDRPSFGLMQRLVEQGLPRRALRHLAREIVEDPERAAALEHRIVPRTTLARRGEDGLLTPEESEKTERLARLYVQAARALGDPADAREFLARPHPELEGRAPLEAGLTDLGARRVEAILNGIEHGLPV
jgi:putative toxin-antitoxin system antitoxin component (TIGR02293 family)